MDIYNYVYVHTDIHAFIKMSLSLSLCAYIYIYTHTVAVSFTHARVIYLLAHVFRHVCANMYGKNMVITMLATVLTIMIALLLPRGRSCSAGRRYSATHGPPGAATIQIKGIQPRRQLSRLFLEFGRLCLRTILSDIDIAMSTVELGAVARHTSSPRFLMR